MQKAHFDLKKSWDLRSQLKEYKQSLNDLELERQSEKDFSTELIEKIEESNSRLTAVIVDIEKYYDKERIKLVGKALVTDRKK